MQANLIAGLVSILLQAQQVHTSHLTALQGRVNDVRASLEGVNTAADQDLFIQYNIRAFSVPNDWGWEPCAGYYDTGEMVVEPEPKIVLQNKLSRCREKLQAVNSQVNSQSTPMSAYCRADWPIEISKLGNDVNKLSNVLGTYMSNRNLGSVDDIMDVSVSLISCLVTSGLILLQDYLGVQHQLTLYEFSAAILSAEVNTISDNLGGSQHFLSAFSYTVLI